ncbi:hypothetical protein K8O61_14565 [Xanthomonas cerealis pv. cerealis]|uniref:hypothetical protein n=1 Tax=Xanthomonas cerealis TaxID=3390025 RepID=UPI001F282842|nr:hypothetical protein [Xanthomonas translucens]UKE68691.1 hypothetical protein K8O61_14565 [Xanthomonas translucens pv. pistacia]
MKNSSDLPKDAEKFLEGIIKKALVVLKRTKEIELQEWGQSILEQVKRTDVKRSIGLGLDGWRQELMDGPKMSDGNRQDQPVAYALLMDELKVLNARMARMSSPDVYEPVDHVLDIGEIALDSLKDALEKHPLAKGIICLIKELVAIAKSIAKRVRAGW